MIDRVVIVSADSRNAGRVADAEDGMMVQMGVQATDEPRQQGMGAHKNWVFDAGQLKN